ncbi:MAG: hypothetical protein AB7P04_11545 [Bacteriovoracia bacterium]
MNRGPGLFQKLFVFALVATFALAQPGCAPRDVVKTGGGTITGDLATVDFYINRQYMNAAGKIFEPFVCLKGIYWRTHSVDATPSLDNSTLGFSHHGLGANARSSDGGNVQNPPGIPTPPPGERPLLSDTTDFSAIEGVVLNAPADLGPRIYENRGEDADLFLPKGDTLLGRGAYEPGSYAGVYLNFDVACLDADYSAAVKNQYGTFNTPDSYYVRFDGAVDLDKELGDVTVTLFNEGMFEALDRVRSKQAFATAFYVTGGTSVDKKKGKGK